MAQHKFARKNIMPRYSILAFFLVFVGLSVIAKAAYIMFAQHDYWMAVHGRYVTKGKVIKPNRGDILSADGQLLASTLPEYKLYMDFVVREKNPKRQLKEQHKRDSLLASKLDSLSEGMHRLFPDINVDEFKELMLKGQKKKSKNWLLYKNRVSYVKYRQVMELPYFNLGGNRSGFHVEEFKQRVNPFGSLATRTIGTLFKAKDTAQCGIELSYDSILRGKDGLMHRQRVLNKYLSFIDTPAEDGMDVQTTIDVSMQDICEESLNEKLTELGADCGMCILMEVATGDVKAMTSLYRYADGKYRERENGAVSYLGEPGSVFKPVSFMVAMDDGYIDMNTGVNTGCGIMEMYGRKMRDHNWSKGGYGYLTVPEILEKSSNIGVSHLIDENYRNNPKKFVEGIYRTGIADNLHLPLVGCANAKIRVPKSDLSNWSHTALPWMSIGYESQVPPINTLTFYNGIANNGKVMRPRFIKSIMQGGEVVKEFPPVVLRENMCKPQTLHNIQTILEWVVSRGLGSKAGSPYFKVSGKTGTAQVWTKTGFAYQYFVSFAGYFPSDKPQYSCIVCIRKAGIASGGSMCGPVFKRVAETVMAQKVHPDFSTAKDTAHSLQPMVMNGNLTATSRVLSALNIKTSAFDDSQALVWGTCTNNGDIVDFHPSANQTDVVPNVHGMGLRDAVYLLEKLGLRVRVHGIGRVSEQSIAPGTHLVKGQVVSLQLDKNVAETDLVIEKKQADSDTISHKSIVEKPIESHVQSAKVENHSDSEKKKSDKTVPQKKVEAVMEEKKKIPTEKKRATSASQNVNKAQEPKKSIKKKN